MTIPGFESWTCHVCGDERPDARISVESQTWTCHVCGDERPDARISVESQTEVVNGVEIGHNVRYCNDRPACIAAAPAQCSALFDRLRGRHLRSV